MSGHNVFDILGEKHMLRIIMYVRDNPGTFKTDLYNAISTNPRMPLKLEMLADSGILEMNEFGKGISLTLTEKGERIADRVAEIDDLLSNGPF